MVHLSDQKYVEEVQGDVQDNILDEDAIDNVLSDEELEEVQPNVGDDIRHDDMDDDMISGNDDIDDVVDMVDCFNVIFELDDVNVELDEEED